MLRTFIAEPALLGAVNLEIIPGDLVIGPPYQPGEEIPSIKFYADTIEAAQDGSAVSINAILQSKEDFDCFDEDYRINIYAFAFDAAGVVIDSGSVTLTTASPGFKIVHFTVPFTSTEGIADIYLFQDSVFCIPAQPGPNPIGRDSIPTEWSVNSVQN